MFIRNIYRKIFKSRRALKNRVEPSKSLKDYSMDELKAFLNRNECIDARALACLTSEVVRRMIHKEWE